MKVPSPEALEQGLRELPAKIPDIRWDQPLAPQLDSLAQVEFLMQVENHLGTEIDVIRFNRRDLPALEAVRQALKRT